MVVRAARGVFLWCMGCRGELLPPPPRSLPLALCCCHCGGPGELAPGDCVGSLTTPRRYWWRVPGRPSQAVLLAPRRAVRLLDPRKGTRGMHVVEWSVDGAPGALAGDGSASSDSSDSE